MDFYRKIIQNPAANLLTFITPTVEVDKHKELLDKFRQTTSNLEKEFLRQKSMHVDAEPLRSFYSIFQEVLLDEFYQDTFEETHHDTQSLWEVLNHYIDTFSIRYLKGEHSGIFGKDKLSLWIAFELQDKSLSSTFQKLCKNPEIVLRHYNANALIRKEGELIKEILNRLVQLDFNLNSELMKKYQEHKKEQNSDEGSEISLKSLNESGQLSLKEKENIDENQIRQNIDRFKKLLESTKQQKQIDDRQSFIREEYKQYLDEKQENQPFEIFRKILGPKKLRRYTRSKSKKKTLRKTSSFDDLDAKKIAPSGLLKGFFFLGNKDKNKEEEHDEKKLSVSTYGKSDEKGNHSSIMEESFRSDPKNVFTINDYSMHDTSHDQGDYIKSIYLKNVKRSEILFLRKYRLILSEYEYRDPPKKIIKAEDQEYKCFGCGAQFNRLLLTLWSRNAFCHYTGYWYCSDCMSDEKLYIPWYIQERLDFKKYHICKSARDELYKCYSKPNIAIDHMSPVIRNNKDFYETLVMKRQLHLIFDMICDPIHVSDLLRENMNLVLKINLFSVRNLVEINNGAMLHYIEKCTDLLTLHIKGCQDCQSKGTICALCTNSTRIFPYDIRNTSICRKCKTLYHSKCLKRRHCIVCEHDF